MSTSSPWVRDFETRCNEFSFLRKDGVQGKIVSLT